MTSPNIAYRLRVLGTHPNSAFGGTSFMLGTLYGIAHKTKNKGG